MQRARLKDLIKRVLMVLPPLALLLYTLYSFGEIRSLMSSSSSFHMEYADNLIEDYLELEIDAEVARLKACLLQGRDDCDDALLVTLEEDGPVYLTLDAIQRNVYLRRSALPEALPDFFGKKKGLSALYSERFHEPVYWFRIRDTNDTVIYQSNNRPAPAPEGADNRAVFKMDRTLVGYQLDIVYNSFGPKQLYSVARNRINFGLILFLFIFAVFSIFLVTYSIRQKLILARQKSFFVSTVSHEFKTPLAIMKLAVETLAAGRVRGEEDEKRFRNMLVSELNRLNQLVHKILSFNKIETSQIQFQMQPTDLHVVLAPSIDAFKVRAAADRIDLVVNQDPESLPIEGDPDMIRQALDNIIENAFKYRGDSTRIEVSLRRQGDNAVAEVRDYGMGIAPEEQHHITKSFYRIKNPATEGIRGSGLGLAISKYILDRNGGKLSLDSALNQGSTFTVSFPLRNDNP